MQMVTFYRVDLTNGITVEDRPSGHYRGSAEYGRSVFKNLRKAKATFVSSSNAEIRRLRDLQRAVRPLATRDELKGHAYIPYEPPEA